MGLDFLMISASVMNIVDIMKKIIAVELKTMKTAIEAQSRGQGPSPVCVSD